MDLEDMGPPIGNDAYNGIYRVFILWFEKATAGGTWDHTLTTQEVYERFVKAVPQHVHKGRVYVPSVTGVGRWLGVYWAEHGLAGGKMRRKSDGKMAWHMLRWREDFEAERALRKPDD